MNLLGRAAKIVNWVLFGKGKSLLQVAEKIASSTEIKIEKDGVVIKFAKEF